MRALYARAVDRLTRPCGVGTAPLVIQWLGGAGHSSWFFLYVAVGAVIAFVATLTLPETKGSVLR